MFAASTVSAVGAVSSIGAMSATDLIYSVGPVYTANPKFQTITAKARFNSGKIPSLFLEKTPSRINYNNNTASVKKPTAETGIPPPAGFWRCFCLEES